MERKRFRIDLYRDFEQGCGGSGDDAPETHRDAFCTSEEAHNIGEELRQTWSANYEADADGWLKHSDFCGRFQFGYSIREIEP